jgi:hypothetical protein
MAQKTDIRPAFYACAMILLSMGSSKSRADDTPELKQHLQKLEQQNQALQEQLRQQQAVIESLTHKVNKIEEASAQRDRMLETAQPEIKEPPLESKSSGTFGLGKVNISGEGGVAFFHTGSEGAFPNAEFRVDEAKLFVEAPIWGDVYFFTELNLMTREASDLSLQLGELYLDFENISRLWNRDRMLNLRVGRMDIPFGEEYQTRDAIDNPLISHSLSDLWGIDEGIELYGSVKKFSYVLAVQNGGASGVRDFDGDKSVAGRVSFDPAKWLHLSASGMRTGELKAPGDYWSELYFANGWFLPSASTNTTRYHANLAEADVELRLPHDRIKAFGGYIRYDDSDSSANNGRDVFYYSVEGVHKFSPKFYAGVRFSQIFADKGFPIAGHGNLDDYLFSGTLTEEIWRLSLGLGYRWSENLLVKAEYTFERGKELGGEKRNHEDLFAIEAAFKF